MDYEDAYEDLKTEFEQYKRESVKWGINDFLDLEVDGYTITEVEAQNALEAMIHDHACNYGITWETVKYYYQEFGTELDQQI